MLSTNPVVMSNFLVSSNSILLSVKVAEREKEIKHSDVICPE